MNAKLMEDMGYVRSGSSDVWISPTTGEMLSFEQARQEAECEREKLIKEIAAMAEGGPTNGHSG